MPYNVGCNILIEEMEDKMRKYDSVQSDRLMQVICNQCGKAMRVENGYLKEGCFCVDAAFGYFSRKDGTRHKFDLCEDCYDKMVQQFTVPVDESPNHELM